MARGKFILATPHLGSVHAEYARSLFALQRYDSGHDNLFLDHVGVYGTLLAHARNYLVCSFLGYKDAEWILFCDSDQDFTPEQDNLLDSADAGSGRSCRAW